MYNEQRIKIDLKDGSFMANKFINKILLELKLS